MKETCKFWVATKEIDETRYELWNVCERLPGPSWQSVGGRITVANVEAQGSGFHEDYHSLAAASAEFDKIQH